MLFNYTDLQSNAPVWRLSIGALYNQLKNREFHMQINIYIIQQ
jgi:hypothetical protein